MCLQAALGCLSGDLDSGRPIGQMGKPRLRDGGALQRLSEGGAGIGSWVVTLPREETCEGKKVCPAL